MIASAARRPGRSTHAFRRLLGLCLLVALGPAGLAGQQTPGNGSNGSGTDVPMDPIRARDLYVSNRWEDHPVADYARDTREKARIDSIYHAVTEGVVDFRRITYRSRVGDLTIPAYLFQPLDRRGPHGHAAMIWVHGGVHGNWSHAAWPFVREAVERGYVVITPEYRGSTGFGAEHHDAIDYGGFDVDDVLTAYDWMVENLPHVDPGRVGIMGWSHGGLITILALTRDRHPLRAGAAIVPVTNLIFRLSWKGPAYQRLFATQRDLRGLPFEEREEYVRRSPYYQVDNLRTPLLVHVATNDRDVDFEESSMLIHKLRALKPDLGETKIYVDPDGWGSTVGHSFSRRVDANTLERVDSPAQIDSWNRTWTFMEDHLRPYEDPSRTRP